MTFLKGLPFLVLFSLSLGAVSLDQIKEAFNNDPMVKEKIAQAKSENKIVDDDIGVVFLSESCGFIGCIGHYLASVGVRPEHRSVNPQSTSILAKIIFNNNAFFSLTLLDSSQI